MWLSVLKIVIPLVPEILRAIRDLVAEANKDSELPDAKQHVRNWIKVKPIPGNHYWTGG